MVVTLSSSAPPAHHAPPPELLALSVPNLLIASVVVVSVLAWIVPPLRHAMLLIPWRVRHRWELHRLLTNGWVHADVMHLAFNMFTLWFFADRVDRVLGDGLFLVLYVSAVVASAIPTTLRKMGDLKYGSLGASGAVAAVIFSAILLYPNLKLTLFFLPILVPGWAWAILYLAYSAVHSFRARDGINHDAHFSGAIYGALFTFAVEPDRAMRTLQQLF